MPRPANEQINDLIGFVIPLGYAAMGFYLIQSAPAFAATGVLSEGISQILGGLFIAYGVLKMYWALRRWKRNQRNH
ncbi:MAG: hypothetical protein QM669_12985 [Siphonobacter sp.]